jgi:hypothetical protein
MPDGFNAFFSVDLNADMGISGNGVFDIIVGSFSALVLDLDPLKHSGPAMMEVFEDLDLNASYATSLPDDLSMYKSIFVSLGIILSGHELTSIESAKLVQYLNDGGKLYLEGRRTWHGNPPQPIHTKFNIDVVEDTWFEYDTINGETGSFTEGMVFEFGGSSPYNNYYMVPVGSAFTIFTSPTPDFAGAVAYDEGTYKTIGCAFEFGDLIDADNPSTKQRLMLEYLDFFGDIVIGIPDENQQNSSASLGDSYPNPFTEQTTISFSLQEDMPVSIEVFSVNGTKVAGLLDKKMKAGGYAVQWDGTDVQGNKLNSGIYLISLKTSSVITTKKVILY